MCSTRKARDLTYQREKIERSRVQSHEAGTKTARSNREIHLHENLVDVLRTEHDGSGDPYAHFFTTPKGMPIDENNFDNRHWLPRLKQLKIRPGPFYNTGHSYTSFMLSVGAKLRLRLCPDW